MASLTTIPRELQEMIFSQLLISIEDFQVTNYFRITAKNIPNVDILLVNKQIRHDYQSIADEKSSMTIYNHSLHPGHCVPVISGGNFMPHEYVSIGNGDMSLSDAQNLPKLPFPALRIPVLNLDLECSRSQSNAGEQLAILETWTFGIIDQYQRFQQQEKQFQESLQYIEQLLKKIEHQQEKHMTKKNKKKNRKNKKKNSTTPRLPFPSPPPFPPPIKHITLDIIITSRTFRVRDFEAEMLASGNWTGMPVLKSLRIWRDKSDDRIVVWKSMLGLLDREGERSLLMEWERERARFWWKGGGKEREEEEVNTGIGMGEEMRDEREMRDLQAFLDELRNVGIQVPIST